MPRDDVQTNELCEKLRARFENRGINNPQVKNKISLHKEHTKAMRSARARREAMEEKYRASRIEPGFTSAKRRIPGREYERRAYESFEAEKHYFVPDGGNFGLAFEKGAAIRRRAAAFNVEAYERRHPKNETVKETKKEPSKKTFASVLSEKISASLPRKSDGAPESNERYVRKSPLPKGVVAAVLICTVLLMVVLYTYSSYTQVVADGKALQAERTELLSERSRLVNMLEMRDDVREIEDYATNTIGMVKSDLVETRHVSIAGGERIEVIRAEGTEEEGGLFSTIMSAMGTNWQGLFDSMD
ncbi:MAG: hypothetical protein IJS45_04195 [Clostridia bacterium]|nr:hypothetical protein [Clostridia bacterium]